MSSLLTFLAVAAAILVGWPLFSEDTSDMCQAVESKALVAGTAGSGDAGNLFALQMLQRNVSHGEMVRSVARQRYPGIPPFLTCTYIYWRVTAEPLIG